MVLVVLVVVVVDVVLIDVVAVVVVVVVVVGTFGFGVRHSPWRTTCSAGVGQWWVVL